MDRIAMLAIHSCPLARLGEKDAGGMNVYVLALSQALERLGFGVDIYTRHHQEGDPPVVQVTDLVRVIHIPAGEPGRTKEELYEVLPELTEGILRFVQEEGLRYGLVHSHYWLSGPVARRLQEAWGVPHVTSFHTLAEVKRRALVGAREPPLRSETETEMVATADAVVAFTRHERDALVRYYKADPRRVEIIPCGVDLELFRPLDRGAARRELGLGDEAVLLFVGRIEPLKGVDILLQAAAQQEEPVQVLLVGGEAATAEVRRLKELAVELGLGERARFVGPVPHPQLPTYYNAADVLVVPSYSESFGLVAAEALACGTPVVASKVGGLPSVIQDGETGYLISYRCPDTFAERLELLVGNPLLRQSLGARARPSMERLGWGVIAPRMAELYASLRPAPVEAS